MKISARVQNRAGQHSASVDTDGRAQNVTIASRPAGFGSSVNGGELLFLALATCYCNDIYREAANRSIQVRSVEVSVEGQFGAAGEPASDIRYRATIAADAAPDEIRQLARETDRVAEIQNTVRAGASVTLDDVEAICTAGA